MLLNRPTIVDEEDINCLGDVNGDYVVGANDLISILACWEDEPVGECEGADLNLDGIVGATDILLLNTAYGNTCYGPMWDYIQEGPPVRLFREVNTERRWRDVMNDIYKP